MPKGDRFAGTHIDTPEIDGSLLGHNIFYQVEIADRDTAGGQDEIGLHGLAEFLAQALHGVPRYSQAVWNGSRASHRRLKQVAVAVADFARLQGLIDIDDLVACSQDGDVRTA